MTRHRDFAPQNASDLKKTLDIIDHYLTTKQQRVQVTALGGLAIILLGFRERATVDIDLAPHRDAELFQKAGEKLKIPVDIVTVSTTVDFDRTTKVNLYTGKFLRVDSVPPADLIKLKLERFLKQDPEDIYAVIQKTNLPYESFKTLVREMLTDFIGNPRTLLLSAMIVVEQMYPASVDNFSTTFKLKLS